MYENITKENSELILAKIKESGGWSTLRNEDIAKIINSNTYTGIYLEMLKEHPNIIFERDTTVKGRWKPFKFKFVSQEEKDAMVFTPDYFSNLSQQEINYIIRAMDLDNINKQYKPLRVCSLFVMQNMKQVWSIPDLSSNNFLLLSKEEKELIVSLLKEENILIKSKIADCYKIALSDKEKTSIAASDTEKNVEKDLLVYKQKKEKRRQYIKNYNEKHLTGKREVVIMQKTEEFEKTEFNNSLKDKTTDFEQMFHSFLTEFNLMSVKLATFETLLKDYQSLKEISSQQAEENEKYLLAFQRLQDEYNGIKNKYDILSEDNKVLKKYSSEVKKHLQDLSDIALSKVMAALEEYTKKDSFEIKDPKEVAKFKRIVTSSVLDISTAVSKYKYSEAD